MRAECDTLQYGSVLRRTQFLRLQVSRARISDPCKTGSITKQYDASEKTVTDRVDQCEPSVAHVLGYEAMKTV